ncbi:PTP type protein phosphatase, partial [Trinorchestia longiramus]
AIRECLNFSHDVMGGKLSAAQKENEFVFHEKVPDVSTLPEVKGASLVKGIQFSMTDPDVAGLDIFRNLIPMEAHQASSLYSEEKASLLRKLGAQLQEKNDELDAFLASLQLEDLLLDEDPDSLPQELVSACADLNSRNALKELTAVMSKVSSAHLDISELLDKHTSLLQQEEERAAEFRAMMGDKKAPNNLLVELRREGEKCRGALAAANESNMALHTAVVQYRPSLTTLSQPLQHVASTLPSVAEAAAQQAGTSGAEAKVQIERLMKKVEEMQQQRWSVEQQLRQNLMEDDITGVLVTAESDVSELFKEHLKKHDQQLEILEKNMSAQKNILTALSEANATYASTRRATKQATAARQAAIGALVQAHASFSSILDKARDANAFYEKLSAQVTKLLKRTESFVSVQEEEREGRLNAQAKKFTQRAKGDQLPASSSKVVSSYPSHTPVAPLPGGDDSLSYTGSGPKLKDVLMASGGYKGLPSTGQFSPQHRVASYGASSYPYMPGAAGSTSSAAPATYLAHASTGAVAATTAAPAVTGNFSAMPAPPSGISASSYTQPGASYSPAPVTGYGTAYPAYPPSAPSPAPQIPLTQFPAATSSTAVSSCRAPAPYAPTSYPPASTAAPFTAPYAAPTSAQYPAASYSANSQPSATITLTTTPQPNSVPGTRYTQAQTAYSAGEVTSQTMISAVTGVPSTTSALPVSSVSGTSTTSLAEYNKNIPSSVPAGAVSSGAGSVPYVANPYYYANQSYPGSSFAAVAGQQYSGAPAEGSQQYLGNFAGTGLQYPSNSAGAAPPYPSGSVTPQQYPGGSATVQPYPSSSAGASQQYPGGSAGAGQQYPSGSAGAGQQYPSGSAGAGQQYPSGSAGAGQQYPSGSAGAGQQYPSSSAGAGQQYPGGSAGAGQQYPSSSTGAPPPYPGGSATVQQYPGSSATVQQYPSSSGTVQQYPSSSGTVQQYPGSSGNVQQYPGSSGTVQQYPGSSGNVQQYPGSSGTVQQFPGSSAGAGQQYPGSSTEAGAVQQYPLVPPQVYPVGTTVAAQPYTAGAFVGSRLVHPVPYPSGATTHNQVYGGVASTTAPVQAQPAIPTASGASCVSTISSQPQLATGMSTAVSGLPQYPTPAASMAPLRAPYGTPSQQFNSPYASQHSYHTPQHLMSPFVPNQYPSGTASFTPSMSIASSFKSSMPYHVESVSYHSTMATASTSGVTVVSSVDASDGRPPYRHPSAAAIPSYYYARAGAGPASNITPSSAGSPLPSAGFGLKNGGPASSTGQANDNYGSANPSVSSEYPIYSQLGSQPYNNATAAAPPPQQQYPGLPQHPQLAQAQPVHPQPASQHAQVPVSQTPIARDATTSKKGISNLDLLSGIELAGPSSIWTPLTPQPSKASVTESSVPSAELKKTTAMNGSYSFVAVATTTAAASLNSMTVSSVAASALTAPNGLHATPASGTGTTSTLSSISGSPVHEGNAVAVSDAVAISTATLSIAALAQSKKAAPPQDPLDDPGTLAALTADTERLHKTVETQERRSLNGATNLEMKWREIMDAVEARCKKATVSVGRCYPFKNRFPDILPYDHSRVVLTDTSDDYINASHVQVRGSHSFPFVVTQAPTPNTAADYWLMIWQLQTELILCLHTLPEIKNASYWPEGREAQQFGDVTVQEHNSGEGGGGAWMQRLFHLTRTTASGSASTTRAVIHLQFLGWPPGGIPNHPSPLLQLCGEALSLYHQQRVRQRPVVVTCVAGVGRSCVAALLTVFLSHLHTGGMVCDLQSLCEDACVARRGGLQDKDYLAFLYSAALYAAQELLMKRGILTNKATFEEGPLEKGHRQHVRHPSADLLAATCDFNRLKCKLGLDQPDDQPSTAQKDQAETESCSVDWSSSSESSEQKNTSRVDTVTSSSTTVPPASSVSGLPLPPNLAASLDPQQLKIEPAAPGKGAKITKESFERPSKAGLTSRPRDPDDPLSDLDPLWTLKKSE